jgi:geranylgeranyl diphosphate synthase type I
MLETIVPIQDYLARYIPAVDSEILRVVEGAGDCGLYSLALYQLGWMDSDHQKLSAQEAGRHGGKKLRPAMLLLACEACGGDWMAALSGAAAVELIHNFSLVHDDVEDGDRLRRHRPTVWGAFGIPKAVNCGSAMQALVYRAALGLTLSGHDTPTCLGIIELLTNAILEMTEGQHLDIDFQERGHITVQDYFDMTSRKTGALLDAALRIGARVAGATRETEISLGRFGRLFGLAFQARDDYLGCWGDPYKSGKAVGADIEKRKKSLPVVFALERDASGAGAVTRSVMRQESIAAADVERVLHALDECGARAFTESAARERTAEAIAVLESAVPDSAARQALLDIANMAAGRAN